jgi:hypothetical protein
MERNIYKIGKELFVTSDEEIKEGDYWFDGTNIRHDFPSSFVSGIDKKIILTTDQDLDGVQAIDDDFLEWFVNNPSCEEIEVIHGLFNLMERQVDPMNLGQNHSQCVWKYKIIIPKEEPLIEFTNTNDFTSMIYNPTDEQGRLMTYWGGLEEPKQETLEEAAERILANNVDGLSELLQDDDLFFFYKGVIQCYGEAMAEWQAEIMYSKTIEFAEWCDDMGYIQVTNSFWKSLNDEKGKTTKELFEQFKNKTQ